MLLQYLFGEMNGLFLGKKTHDLPKMTADSPRSTQTTISISIQIPSQKCSLSCKQPFQIGVSLTSHSEDQMFTRHPIKLHLMSKAHTRGPAFQFLDASTNAVMATYRLELCHGPEVMTMLFKAKITDPFRPSRASMAKEYALKFYLNEKGDTAEEWCKDLMGKLVNGRRYKIRIVDNAGERMGFQKMKFRVWYCGGADMFGVTD
ncbi:hypothetical protein, variant [Exophiala mesophila]|uniref:Uncharacterized protein n=1 Tax=Exophiala mesophila TaxID=212818 RepID=A0A0D1ZP02_EXOME|nr:hypothetical protein, variant [Exophiala mesophila]KIV95714.1 hypothetical protein, variant [Exophiala mesophila]